MKKAFTLLELLVVMGLIGLLGTITVGGYRALQRGMEERGAMQNVNALIRAAYQRAQIDRQPVVVYFWNETLRSATSEENEIVVGRCVAVRRAGRFSAVQGVRLIDEFADLQYTYPVVGSSGSGSAGSASSGSGSRDLINIYPMEQLSSIASGTTLKRSKARSAIELYTDNAIFLSGTGIKDDPTAAEGIPAYAFVVVDPGGVNWIQGMSYGFEFLELELPQNFIFGSQYSKSTDSSVKEAGTLVFDVGVNTGAGLTKGGTIGRNSITVYSLRQDGAELKAQAVGTTDSPEKDL